MDKQTSQNLWHKLTTPRSTDANEARQEHMTNQAAQLKGTRTIVTGISDAVAEAIVDLGID